MKQWSRRQSAHDADWIVGSGQYAAGIRAAGLRSLAAPGTAYDDPVLGKDPQPAHMRDYADPDNDRANVHVNSGIPNHAFYLFARELGGHAWGTAGEVWYAALQSGLDSRCTFGGFARATLKAAHHHGASAAHALRHAWSAVGVSVTPL